MPGYRPSAFGAATKVRIGGPDIAISTYSVVMTIVCSESGEDFLNSRKKGSQKWSGRLDLNQRPHAPQACALPGCATSRPGFPMPRRHRKNIKIARKDAGDAESRLSLSPAFEKCQEAAERVAQVEEHLAVEHLGGVLAGTVGRV